ncbi:helix-turn-helix domain-containing protein [Thermocrispum sp.]|uniref:PucR family transcriptional regulator n=1 Tax=Thermocrispum sp. TaxID=2060768 RepID=UPI002580C461|nr:helix-turn-helix domain-containing protein [Thermocrispum sp.]
MTTAYFRADVATLQQRCDELSRRLAIEMRLSQAAAAGKGIAGLVREIVEMTPNPLWLIDQRRRVVARSVRNRGSDFAPPDVDLLLEHNGPVDLTAAEPLVIEPDPPRGVVRRHLLMPVARGGSLFAWLVMAEVARRFRTGDVVLASRSAFHLAGEYAVQAKIARVSWNARSALTRQLLRGPEAEDDLAAAAEYLGVLVDVDRVVVHVAETADRHVSDERKLADELAALLGVEVLGTHVGDGVVLLVEAADTCGFVQQVKDAVRQVIATVGRAGAAAGVSGVTAPSELPRAHREAREVALCVQQFASSSERVVTVDELGPARLFVANSDIAAVRRYVRDVLGKLLSGAPGTADLLRTLQCFFDTGRSVRESAGRLGIHENTVRLRLAKVCDITGLDVASDADDQLSVQTALLVLRLEGHPAVPSFAERGAVGSDRTRTKDTA